jgi:hypothetical protein
VNKFPVDPRDAFELLAHAVNQPVQFLIGQGKASFSPLAVWNLNNLRGGYLIIW